MSIEITLLVWSVGLTFLQMIVSTVGAAQLFGLPKLAGNREGLPSAAGWAGVPGALITTCWKISCCLRSSCWSRRSPTRTMP